MREKIVSAANPVVADTGIANRAVDEVTAAAYVGISASSLRKGRMNGLRDNHMPPPTYVRVGRRIVYLLDDLDRWLEENRVSGLLTSAQGSKS